MRKTGIENAHKAWKVPVVVTGIVSIFLPAIRSAATTITRGSAALVAPLPLFVSDEGTIGGRIRGRHELRGPILRADRPQGQHGGH